MLVWPWEALRPDWFVPDANEGPRQGYAALRRHRISRAEADYFLTINLRRPANGLHRLPVRAVVEDELRRGDLDGGWRLRTCVVMSDHLHVLATLGPHRSPAEVV